jgi:hypothetical protein
MKALLIITATAAILSLLSLSRISNENACRISNSKKCCKKEIIQLPEAKKTYYPDFMLYTLSAL